ncbi:MAG: TOBE domain-containing protein [Bacilli bacterium]
MVIFGIRPEDVHHEIDGDSAQLFPDAIFDMKVDVAELLGHEYILHGKIAGNTIVSKVPVIANQDIHIGDMVRLALDLRKAHFFKVDTAEELENLPMAEQGLCII